MRRRIVITEADWRAAIQDEIKLLRQPEPPPEGFLSFNQWKDILNRSDTSVRLTLASLTKTGKIKCIEIPALTAAGRVSPRRFWGPLKSYTKLSRTKAPER